MKKNLSNCILKYIASTVRRYLYYYFSNSCPQKRGINCKECTGNGKTRIDNSCQKTEFRHLWCKTYSGRVSSFHDKHEPINRRNTAVSSICLMDQVLFLPSLQDSYKSLVPFWTVLWQHVTLYLRESWGFKWNYYFNFLNFSDENADRGCTCSRLKYWYVYRCIGVFKIDHKLNV